VIAVVLQSGGLTPRGHCRLHFTPLSSMIGSRRALRSREWRSLLPFLIQCLVLRPMSLGKSAGSAQQMAGPSSSAAPPLSTSSQPTILLAQNVLETFQPSKVYGTDLFDEKASVTSLSFDDKGDFLVSASSDMKIQIWNCRTGKHTKKLYSQKYGVDLARFTHRNDAIIYASTKVDNTIRHHSISKNVYLQYFRGHETKVTSLQMSPINDTFLSAAFNESVRLWDLRTPTCQGLLPLQGHPLIAFSPEGSVFAIAFNELSIILLYDLRNFTKVSQRVKREPFRSSAKCSISCNASLQTPFMQIPLNDEVYHATKSFPPRAPIITSLTFSPSGVGLLVGTAGDVHYLVCSHTGHTLHRLRNHEGLEKAAGLGEGIESGMVPEASISGQECGWTPDGRFVFSGEDQGRDDGC
jgi:COMPASS component SWD2